MTFLSNKQIKAIKKENNPQKLVAMINAFKRKEQTPNRAYEVFYYIITFKHISKLQAIVKQLDNPVFVAQAIACTDNKNTDNALHAAVRKGPIKTNFLLAQLTGDEAKKLITQTNKQGETPLVLSQTTKAFYGTSLPGLFQQCKAKATVKAEQQRYALTNIVLNGDVSTLQAWYEEVGEQAATLCKQILKKDGGLLIALQGRWMSVKSEADRKKFEAMIYFVLERTEETTLKDRLPLFVLIVHGNKNQISQVVNSLSSDAIMKEPFIKAEDLGELELTLLQCAAYYRNHDAVQALLVILGKRAADAIQAPYSSNETAFSLLLKPNVRVQQRPFTETVTLLLTTLGDQAPAFLTKESKHEDKDGFTLLNLVIQQSTTENAAGMQTRYEIAANSMLAIVPDDQLKRLCLREDFPLLKDAIESKSPAILSRLLQSFKSNNEEDQKSIEAFCARNAESIKQSAHVDLFQDYLTPTQYNAMKKDTGYMPRFYLTLAAWTLLTVAGATVGLIIALRLTRHRNHCNGGTCGRCPQFGSQLKRCCC